ncbi:MAG TPA: type II toxin-antitoxin system YafQ family toxin [Thermodesulfovibrionales bacterium]|nr:type II toxin-antitoxin system YafQ family toxin [Thermodesulfovibrionales bacterium]
MLGFKTTKQFEGDYRLMVKRGKDIQKLKTIMRQVVNQQTLESKYHDHALRGNLRGHRDCHLEPDWILIYRIDRALQEITFVRTGSHADLFG